MPEPADLVNLAAPVPAAPQRVTLHLDARAILRLAAGYEADKAAGMSGKDLALKYLEPAFEALGSPLPADAVGLLALAAQFIK